MLQTQGLGAGRKGSRGMTLAGAKRWPTTPFPISRTAPDTAPFVSVRRNSCVSVRQRPMTTRMCSSTWGDDSERVCPYCSTLYVYDATLTTGETVPEGCVFHENRRLTGRLPLSGGSSDILIAGAGIAGLTAAFGLRFSVGFPSASSNAPPELVDIGAGLQLSPNATRLLDSLGLAAALRQAAVRPEAIVLRRASTSREIARVPLGTEGTRRWGADYLVIHRADLQSILLDAVKAHPAIRLHLGLAIEHVRQHAGGVTISLSDGTSQAEGSLLIGADGVWSRLRDQLGGQPARPAGHTAWRAVIAP